LFLAFFYSFYGLRSEINADDDDDDTTFMTLNDIPDIYISGYTVACPIHAKSAIKRFYADISVIF